MFYKQTQKCCTCQDGAFILICPPGNLTCICYPKCRNYLHVCFAISNAICTRASCLSKIRAHVYPMHHSRVWNAMHECEPFRCSSPIPLSSLLYTRICKHRYTLSISFSGQGKASKERRWNQKEGKLKKVLQAQSKNNIRAG
jgi:hypothetical protein